MTAPQNSLSTIAKNSTHSVGCTSDLDPFAQQAVEVMLGPQLELLVGEWTTLHTGQSFAALLYAVGQVDNALMRKNQWQLRAREGKHRFVFRKGDWNNLPFIQADSETGCGWWHWNQLLTAWFAPRSWIHLICKAPTYLSFSIFIMASWFTLFSCCILSIEDFYECNLILH